MSTLVQIFTHPLTLAIIAMFAGFAALELVAPARRLPRVRAWRLRGTLSFLLAITISSLAPLAWDAWLAEHRLVDARGLGHVAGAIAGFLVLELGVYVWHRAVHKLPFLWRASHQMHHSAERVDVFGAFWFHPLDVASLSLVTSVALVGVLGVTAPAAIAASLAATFCGLFQHANVRTPRWLGYLVQRPESHAVHHQRGVHAYNYSDLPLWDIVFGTFANPATFEGENGFWDGASDRVLAMLVARDVSTPPAEREPARERELAAEHAA